MSELVDDYDNAQMLAYEEAQKLLQANPKHELLKYFVLPDEAMNEDGSPDLVKHQAIRTELKDRFWGRPEPWQEQKSSIWVMTVVLANYYQALQRANAAIVSV